MAIPENVTRSYQPRRLSDDSPVADYERKHYVGTGKTVSASGVSLRSAVPIQSVVPTRESVAAAIVRAADAGDEVEGELLARLIRHAAALHSRHQAASSAGMTLAQRVVIHCAAEACGQLQTELESMLIESPAATISSTTSPAAPRRGRKSSSSEKDSH
jgi:hypothetical protein